MKEKLINDFARVFGDSEGVITCFAPGRVNLIGEHTDYNGGHVFPCALTIGTYAVARKNQEQVFRFYSNNFADFGIITVPFENLVYQEEHDWTNYVKGVIDVFRKWGMLPDCGFDMLLEGNIPNGSGLSSSASVEVLTGHVLRELFGFTVDNQELALIGQRAENDFVGMNCGIMDQFAIAMGKKDYAIFLDTSTLEFTYAPIAMEHAKIVIACSNKKRKLGESKYNERRSQCEAALAQLKTVIEINSLGDLTEEQFEKYQYAITDPVNRKRAKHAVSENQRTVQAVRALEEKNLKRFGELMNASHISLRDDYEVTGLELDTLVEAAWKQPGVIGSRMTGAGFGGCTVSIVEEAAIENFIAGVGKQYQETVGYAADFYVVEVGNGPLTV